jgi:hypothetical protein
MTATAAVCTDCREMQINRPWVLRALGHDACMAAIRAEQQAARRFGVRFNPDGCAEGSTYAGRFDTSDKIHKEFATRAADRRRESAEGWRHEVLSHDEWRQSAEPCLLGQCEHRLSVVTAEAGR